jgi:NADH-quinone oxidoreductase subunit J
MVDVIVFAISAAIVLGGGLGVISFRNPVHAALSLIATFFGVAVLFILQEAHFLALVQVVVYAGAVVVLFLFVIMLLGVDSSEDVSTEPIVGHRPLAAAGAGLILLLALGGLFLSGPGGDDGSVALTGQPAAVTPIDDSENIVQLARDLFTRNILAFEATALLLTIATVGAVVLVRNQGGEDLVVDDPGSSVR